MGTFQLFILAIGLAMDAFAVSICRGLNTPKATVWHSMEAGLYFGGFQALMPLIGYLIGNQFYDLIHSVDHWVAFILLVVLGIRMIKSSLNKDEEGESSQSMLILAIATSIDALAVGISLSFLAINIIRAITLIGFTTFILSAIGIKIGAKFGAKNKPLAEFFGGIILIGIGLKILLEHLFFGG